MKKVLVIDNHFEGVEALLIYLGEKGYHAIYRRNEIIVLRELEKIQPDIILLDVMLNFISGFEVCLRIKEKANLPVIFISALSGKEYFDRAKDCKADAYIPKPFEPSKIMRKIEELLYD